jgi:tight adherence protein C
MNAAFVSATSAGSVFLLVVAIGARRPDPLALLTARSGGITRANVQRAMLGRIGRGPVARALQRTRWLPGRPDVLGRDLHTAGWALDADSLLGLKTSLSIVSGAVFLAVGFGTAPGIIGAALVAVAAYRAPDVVVARRAKRVRLQMGAHVPDLVEVLVATTEAGLSPLMAFQRAAETTGGPLGRELRLAAREIDLGASWRVSLDALVERTDVPSLRRLALALSRSSRLGTSLTVALRSVATELRAERRLRAEEAARRAPVKMLFPLVFLILPAFLLLTVGPVVLATLRSLH